MGRGAQAFSAGKAEHGDQDFGWDHQTGNFLQRLNKNRNNFLLYITPPTLFK